MALPVISNDQRTLIIRELESISTSKDLSNLGFFGYFGSSTAKKQPHDIDILALPHPDTRPYEAIETLDDIFSEMQKRIQPHGLVASICPRKANQIKTHYLVGQGTGREPINIHRLFFTDRKSIENNNPEGFFDNVEGSVVPIYGSLNMTEYLKEQPSRLVEALILAEDYNTIPLAGLVDDAITIQEAESYANYINKFYGTNINTQAQNIAEAQKVVKNTRRAVVDRFAA